MKKNKILILALLVCLSIPVGAQNTDSNITGIVVDKWGNPVYGASVNVAGIPDVRVETDKDGKFEIAADAGRSLHQRLQGADPRLPQHGHAGGHGLHGQLCVEHLRPVCHDPRTGGRQRRAGHE